MVGEANNWSKPPPTLPTVLVVFSVVSLRELRRTLLGLDSEEGVFVFGTDGTFPPSGTIERELFRLLVRGDLRDSSSRDVRLGDDFSNSSDDLRTFLWRLAGSPFEVTTAIFNSASTVDGLGGTSLDWDMLLREVVVVVVVVVVILEDGCRDSTGMSWLPLLEVVVLLRLALDIFVLDLDLDLDNGDDDDFPSFVFFVFFFFSLVVFVRCDSA